MELAIGTTTIPSSASRCIMIPRNSRSSYASQSNNKKKTHKRKAAKLAIYGRWKQIAIDIWNQFVLKGSSSWPSKTEFDSFAGWQMIPKQKFRVVMIERWVRNTTSVSSVSSPQPHDIGTNRVLFWLRRFSAWKRKLGMTWHTVIASWHLTSNSLNIRRRYLLRHVACCQKR